MRIKVANPALVPQLLEFLRSPGDCAAHQVSPDEIEASLLGSLHIRAQRDQLAKRLATWLEVHPGQAELT